MKFQDLSKFSVPLNFRGRSIWIVQLWWCVQSTAFRFSPQFAYGFRRFLLRVFGAKIGRGVVIRPTVTFTYPWKVSIGDYAWVGDDVVLYSLGEIDIGANAVVSQKCYLCTGDHDYNKIDFPIRGQKIIIEEQVWLAADVFVAPNVTVGKGAVVGARSTVLRDLPPGMFCAGYPAKPIRPRNRDSM